MADARSTNPPAPHYKDPSTLERQPPPAVVTCVKEDEAAERVQPAPAALVSGRGRRRVQWEWEWHVSCRSSGGKVG